MTTAESGKMQVDFADLDYMQKTGLLLFQKNRYRLYLGKFFETNYKNVTGNNVRGMVKK